jgi:diguanylate cyclase (GGDEF)-like protein/PAS domain S-box-containing protein
MRLALQRNPAWSQMNSLHHTAFLDFFDHTFKEVGIGMAIVSLEGSFIWGNRALCTLLGHTSDELTALNLQDLIYTEDLNPTLDFGTHLVAGTLSTFHMETRYWHQTGKVVWAHLSVSLVRDPQGQPLFFLSHVQDITSQKHAQDTLRQMHLRFIKVVEKFQRGVLMEDNAGQIILVNQAFCNLFGILMPPQALLGKACQSLPLTAIADPLAFTSRLEQVKLARIPVTGEAIVLGSGCILERDYLPIDPSSTSLGNLWIYRDMTAQIRSFTYMENHALALSVANTHLEHLARRDALTGLYNRHALRQKLDEELRQVMKYPTTLSLILMDLDNFKRYNDTFGHPAGDAILREVAAIIQNTVRDGDFAVRYGGEEFAILLPHTRYRSSLNLSERLRRAVATYSWHGQKITASFGVATLRLPALPSVPDAVIGQLFTVTDQALYQAKRAGRNLVVHASDA